MDLRDQGIQTQLRNIEARTGATLAQLDAEIGAWGSLRHGEIRTRLQERHGLSHVHADTLIHSLAQMRKDQEGAPCDPLAAIYAGAKAHLRPVHEALLAAIAPWGTFEVAPKQGYVSLRRRKQFCMVGPANRTRVAVGLNARGLEPAGRLRALPPGRLCPFEVFLADPAEVDDELLAWLRTAFDEA